MAFGKKPSSKSPAKSVAPASKPAPVTTPIRNSAIPPKTTPAPAARKVVTRDQIAIRAYEIYRGGSGGSESDNWFRAERELKGL